MENRVAALGSLADVFHVRVHDALHNSISVEVFHVCKPSEGEGDHHLIGIREDVDGDMGSGKEGRLQAMQGREGLQGLEGLGQLDGLGGNGLGSMRPSASEQDDEDGMVVTFDAESFQILEVSPAFTALCGRCQDEKRFDEWLSARCRAKFLRTYQNFFNQWTDSGEATSTAIFINMPMKVPLTTASTLRVVANVTMTLKVYDGRGEVWAVSEAKMAVVSDPKLERTQHRAGRSRSRESSEREASSGSASACSSDSGRTSGIGRAGPVPFTLGKAAVLSV